MIIPFKQKPHRQKPHRLEKVVFDCNGPSGFSVYYAPALGVTDVVMSQMGDTLAGHPPDYNFISIHVSEVPNLIKALQAALA